MDHARRVTPGQHIILIAGLWLPVAVWDDVVSELALLGHRATPVRLPGIDDGSATATLGDQIDAVLDAVDDAERPVVVGHSAAATLAWIAADRRPDTVATVVLVGGFPSSAGAVYADFFPVEDGGMAFPGWSPFEGPDSDDLDAAARSAIEQLAVAVPEGVATGIVELTDERRFGVPTVLVCPEFDTDQARAWIAAGELPELARATNLSFVDIDSGHWPMVSAPTQFARILAEAAPGPLS